MKRTGFLSPLLPLLLLLAAGFAACGDEAPTASAPGSEPTLDAMSDASHGRRDGLVPLEVGDTWSYEGTFRTLTESGIEDWVVDREETHTVVGTEERFGREYKVMEVVIREHGPFGEDELTQWQRRRQTRAGLYGVDVPSDEPPAGAEVAFPAGASRAWARWPDGIDDAQRPAFERAWRELLARREMVARMLANATAPAARAAASAAENEFTILDYPLHRGASWPIRTDPEFTAYVERIEWVRTEARRVLAWRIRVDNEFLGPNDIVHVWYGPVGFVAQAYRVEVEVIDENGNVLGTMIGEDELTLVSSNVIRPWRDPRAGRDTDALTPRPFR